MPDVEQETNGNLQRTKLGAIAVLSVVLLIVLVRQFRAAPGAAVPETGRSGRTLPTRAAVAQRDVNSAQHAAPSPAPIWPPLTVEQVLEHDPFAVPRELKSRVPGATAAPAADAARAQQEQQLRAELASLERQGVNVVFRNHRGAVAAVGNRLLEVGDVIAGYRVVRIDPDGVFLRKVEPR